MRLRLRTHPENDVQNDPDLVVESIALQKDTAKSLSTCAPPTSARSKFSV